MDALWLTDEQARAVVQQAQADAPSETCGVIGGNGSKAQTIIPVPNAAAQPRTQYRLDERAQIAAFAQIEAAGQALIGIYHSHPEGDPIPSPTDIQLATYPDTAYLIVGLGRSEPRLAAWTMAYGRVERLPLHVGAEPPSETRSAFSSAQKAAILIAVVLAFMLVIWISLSLLPPAPPIPSLVR